MVVLTSGNRVFRKSKKIVTGLGLCASPHGACACMPKALVQVSQSATVHATFRLLIGMRTVPEDEQTGFYSHILYGP